MLKQLQTKKREANIEEERLNLDLIRARVKVDLRKLVEKEGLTTGGSSVDDYLKSLVDTRLNQLGNEKGERDRAFSKMKQGKAWKAAAKGLVTGLVAGGVAQEVGALVRGNQTGLVEGLLHHKPEGVDGVSHFTALESLRRWFTGTLPHTDGTTHAINIDGHDFRVSGDISVVSNPDHTLNILRNGDTIANHIHLDANGHMPAAVQEALEKQGAHVLDFNEHVLHPVDASISTKDYVNEHQNLFSSVKRELWFDNDTPKPVFDHNAR